MMNIFCSMLKNELKNDLKYGPVSLEKEIEFGNDGNVTALQEHNLRFVLGMVKKFMNKYADLFERGLLTEEEVTSAACIALGVACSKWNPAMGFKVTTYAGMYIKKGMDQYMCNEVRRSSTFTRYEEDRSYYYSDDFDDVDYGSDALNYSACQQNNVDDYGNEIESETILVLNPNDFKDESCHYFTDESVLVPQAISEILTEKEAYVVMHSEGVCGCKQMQKQEIAAALKVSTETVRIIRNKALGKLRDCEKLRTYWLAA